MLLKNKDVLYHFTNLIILHTTTFKTLNATVYVKLLTILRKEDDILLIKGMKRIYVLLFIDPKDITNVNKNENVIQ